MGTRQSSKQRTRKLDTEDFKDKPKVSKLVVCDKDEVYFATSKKKRK
jgi:hypothetical protein